MHVSKQGRRLQVLVPGGLSRLSLSRVSLCTSFILSFVHSHAHTTRGFAHMSQADSM